MLEHAGLITRGREAQWRPCRIEPLALKSLDEWLEQYRQFWEERLDRLDDYLRRLTGKEGAGPPKPPKEKKPRRKK